MHTTTFLDRLNQLNLQLVAEKLMSCEYGVGWTQLQTETAINNYKFFLYSKYLFPHIPFNPTLEVDEVWHTHILVDTYQYLQDCQYLYGYILHHRFTSKSQNKSTQSLYFNQNLRHNYAPHWREYQRGQNEFIDDGQDMYLSKYPNLTTAPCVDLPIFPDSISSDCPNPTLVTNH